MLGDCPHCHVRVLAASDGTCPSCRKNVRDLTGVDPDQVTVVLSSGSRMPSVCCAGAEPTKRLVKVVSHDAMKVENPESAAEGFVLGCLLRLLVPLPFVGLIAGGGPSRGHREYRVEVRVS